MTRRLTEEETKEAHTYVLGWAYNERSTSPQATQIARALLDAEDRIAELEKALAPFADMDRPGGDLSEMACKRGIVSDATYLFSRDFRRAAEALGRSTPEPSPE